MAENMWIQVDPSLNRDDVLQYFKNVHTGNRVYGRTSGTLSDHIHLYFLNGTDSGLNLDPATGEVSKDGSILGDLLDIAIIGIAAAAGGAVGAGEAALSDTAKGILDPSAPAVPAGLVFPPA